MISPEAWDQRLGFRSFAGRFAYQDGILEFPDAKAVGASLGFTIRGKMDLGKLTADLEGEVLPLYAVNTMIGKIPLVGPAVTGVDGALVTTSYWATGALGDLEVEVGMPATQ